MVLEYLPCDGQIRHVACSRGHGDHGDVGDRDDDVRS